MMIATEYESIASESRPIVFGKYGNLLTEHMCGYMGAESGGEGDYGVASGIMNRAMTGSVSPAYENRVARALNQSHRSPVRRRVTHSSAGA